MDFRSVSKPIRCQLKAVAVVSWLAIFVTLLVPMASHSADAKCTPFVAQKIEFPGFVGGRKLDLNRIRWESEDSNARSIIDLGQVQRFEDYIASLKALGAKLKARTFKRENVQAVFYPLMGTDVALPLTLFPKVKTIVTIDQVPFLEASSINGKSPIPVRTAIGGAWRRGRHVVSEKSTASRLLGALYEAHPSMRILSMEVFESSQEIVLESGPTHAVSAVLTFDLGDGAGPRQIVHLNQQFGGYWMNRGREHAYSEISQWVQNFTPTVSIVKASEGMGKGFGYTGPPAGLGLEIMNMMRKNHGMLMEGLASEVMNAGYPNNKAQGFKYYIEPEVTEEFFYKQLPNLNQGGLSYIIEDIPFGYDVGVLITEFGN